MLGFYAYLLTWYILAAIIGVIVFRDARKLGRRTGEALPWGIASGLLLPFVALIYYFITRRDWQKEAAGEVPVADESASPFIRFLHSAGRNRGVLVVLLLILFSVGANLYGQGWFCFNFGGSEDVDPLTVQWQSGIGACFDGQYLWVADDGDRSVRKVDPADGSVVAEVPIEGRAEGMAFDGKYLWVSVLSGSYPSGHLVKINAANLKVTVYDQWTVNPDDYGSLYYDGKYLWGGMDSLSKICRTNGIVLEDHLVNNGLSYLSSDGRYLWAAGESFYRIDPENGVIGDPIGLMPGALGGSLVFDGEDLWYYIGPFLYWLDLDAAGNPISVTTMDMPVYGGNSVTDGSSIWMVDYEDGTVAEFDIATQEIIGLTTYSFAEGTYAMRAALAYDGQDVWVVNRANGSVFKLLD
ncbi:MAG: hypothetical protein P3T54_01950 [Dehalogenimonas sp.]|uniref:DUF5050 domain-containing protein n=1 Tax=Candidatus Dehalogenimonas loeffleri TaxID=3127115 RepID=A0ABZ2J5Q7_9CHLR|nr:hypothetical protein [Dehalogenimonas sp.]